MENELKKWERITAGNPSAGRCSVADLWKLLDGATVEAKSTRGLSEENLRKARITALATNILMKRLDDFPKPVMPEAKPYPSPADATFSPVRVSSLGELAQLQARTHPAQLETPQSQWRPHIAKREHVSDDERRQRELDAARRGDPLSLVGSPVH